MALEEVLQRIYEKNPFINLLQMKMESGTGEGGNPACRRGLAP